MKRLTKLVGESWLNDVLADTGRRAHPLRFQLTMSGAAWARWRETFDVAVGVVDELLVNDPAARKRLIAKLKDRRQFWSTVPEIVWPARFHRAGMRVEVEPIIGRPGPDIRFTMAGLTAHAEVYAPVFLDVFRLARRLERKTWTDPRALARHGRPEIVQRLRAKFASEHVDLALVDTLDEQLDPRLPSRWYHQGGLLLDCAEALNVHVAAYEY